MAAIDVTIPNSPTVEITHPNVIIGTCADATVENSDQTVSVTVGSGDTETFPDTDFSINSELVVEQPSGVDKNVTVTVNGDAPISTTVVNSGLVDLEAPAGGGTLTISVYSDAGHTTPITSADFGDTIYIKSTVTGITPTEYRFFVFETASNGVLTVQVGDSISYDITSFNDLVIYAEAKDASVAAAAFTSFEVTINADVDATAFINAHNALSGQTMAAYQQEIVQGIYQRLKGAGTPNGNNLLTYFRTNAKSRWFPLVPVDDSTANVDGYTLDLIHLAVGTYNGFVPTDFSVNGVTGGSGKYFDMGSAPDDFPIDDISISFYSRTASQSSNGVDIGVFKNANSVSESTYIQPRSNNQIFHSLNDSTTSAYASTEALGSFISNRAGTTKTGVKNGVVLSGSNVSTTGTTNRNTYAHATNNGGSAGFFSPKQLSSYHQALGMSTSQIADFEFIVKYIQDNIITGGRNVV